MIARERRFRTGWHWAAPLIAGVAASTAPARAQFTETALTVPPRHWLIEADLANFGADRSDAGRYRYAAGGYLQATRGISDRVDVQLAVQVFQREELAAEPPDLAEESYDVERWGDVYLRSKWRLIGDGEEGWMVSLLPYVLIPTEANEEGHRLLDLGVSVPFSRALNDEWWLDAQVQYHGRKEDGAAREWNWLVSANVQRTWNDRWGSYAELIADFWAGRWSDAAVSAGLGVTRHLTGGLRCDTALYTGLTEQAVDWELAVRVYWEL